MSRLDRFLVSSDWEDLFSLLEASALPHLGSDHTPLLLSGGALRQGSKPFRFQLMWLLHPGFKDLVVDWWSAFEVEGPPSPRFHLKLKLLRDRLHG